MTALDRAPDEQERLVSRLRDSNVLGVLIADDEAIVEANDAVLTMIGYSRADLTTGRINWRDITPPEWRAADDRALRELHATGVCTPFEKEYLHRDGRRVPIILGATAVGTEPPLWISYIVDLSAQRHAEAERAALERRTNDALSLAAVAEQQVAMLVNVGRLLTAALDETALVENAVRLTVPGFADFCSLLVPVDAPTNSGDATRPPFRVAAAAHADPGRAAAVERLRRTTIAGDGSLAAHVAYGAGAPNLISDVEAALTTAGRAAGDDPLAGMIRDLGIRSMLAVPLTTRDQQVGVMVLGREDPATPLTENDVRIAVELANQLAVALSNAQDSRRQTTIAETLQHALLPGELPRIDGVDLAARYLPATEGANVGGDWYDVIPLGGGSVGLVVGDVVGHDLHAATLMGQLRNSVRTLAALLRDPPRVLALANDAIIRLWPGAYATVFYAVLDPGGALTYATAGHPPALLVTADVAEFLDIAPGPLLGAATDAVYPGGTRHLPPAATLVLYTDGIVEQRDRILDEGLERLARTAARRPDASPDEVCDALIRDVLADRPRFDDVCLLVARR
jgi:PAS domain S-box-containing protein